jgi:hypothetical protein
VARSTTNVWARELRIGQNPVRQLLVRECNSVKVDPGNDGSLFVRSPYGAWPARRGSTIGPDEPLTANLPMLNSDVGPIHWRGSREPLPPEQVLASFDASRSQA